jgi:hypothetical protein
MSVATARGVSILGVVPPQYADILSIPAQEFVATLHRCVSQCTHTHTHTHVFACLDGMRRHCCRW